MRTAMGTATRMTVAMMIVIVAIAQQPRADEVDTKAQRRDRYRLAIRNRNRMNQPGYAFIENLNRDQAQDNRAGKGGKVAELAGAEGETRIARVLARKQIGSGGDPQRGRVGCHVPAIGQ